MVYPLPDEKKRLIEAWRGGVAQSVARGVETEAKLRNAKRSLERNKTDTPRFLIRGFNSDSGGGMDPRLNSPEAVIPHAFLDGSEPTTMWDIENLPKMLDLHLEGRPVFTAFSSWSHSMRTAARFAVEAGYDHTIAVLNTASWKEHVHFSDDLRRRKLCRISFKDEYLIYGPVSGPSYHCVSLRKLLMTTKYMDLFIDIPAKFGDERISSIERDAVEASREIAVMLQPLGTGAEEILILTAKFVCMRVADLGRRVMDSEDIYGVLWYLRGDLQDLAMRADYAQTSLCEPYMDTTFSVDLDFEVQFLWAAEDVVRRLGCAARSPISSRLTTTQHGQVGHAHLIPSADIPAKRPRTDSNEESTRPNKRRKSGDGTKTIDTRSDEDDEAGKDKGKGQGHGEGEMDGDMAD